MVMVTRFPLLLNITLLILLKYCYQKKFREIVEEYGVKENGQYKMSPDGQSIIIIPGKEEECNEKLAELRNLEVDIKDIKFSIDELEGIDVSIAELSCLMSLIED